MLRVRFIDGDGKEHQWAMPGLYAARNAAKTVLDGPYYGIVSEVGIEVKCPATETWVPVHSEACVHCYENRPPHLCEYSGIEVPMGTLEEREMHERGAR